jgi:hypothetical protein
MIVHWVGSASPVPGGRHKVYFYVRMSRRECLRSRTHRSTRATPELRILRRGRELHAIHRRQALVEGEISRAYGRKHPLAFFMEALWIGHNVVLRDV